MTEANPTSPLRYWIISSPTENSSARTVGLLLNRPTGGRPYPDGFVQIVRIVGHKNLYGHCAPELIDIILYYDDNEDKYIEENPDNILSINFQLYRLALKQRKLIYNILNKSTILCEPDVKFNK